jgi:hypothetical protein
MFKSLKKIFSKFDQQSRDTTTSAERENPTHTTLTSATSDISKSHIAYGNRCLGAGKLDEAREWYEKAIAADSGNALAYVNLGYVLSEQRHYEEAKQYLCTAMALAPENADSFFLYGKVSKELGRMDAAIASFQKSVDLNSNFGEAHCELVGLLLAIGRPKDALACSDNALRAMSDYGPVHWNAAFVLLLSGDLIRGWEEYEWRWKETQLEKYRRQFKQELWLGRESLEGKTILLHAEQGLGDTIQFSRYAKLVSQRGAQVVLEVQKGLKSLMQSLQCANWVVEHGEALPAFDCHIPMMSLPLAFKTTLETIPAQLPYLHVEEGVVERWRLRLGKWSRPRVGLVWSGRKEHKNDHHRSIELAMMREIFSEEFEFISLQKEVRERDKSALEQVAVKHFGEELKDFMDTAGLVANMDLVISVDTSVAHLAGALGKPLWVLLPFSPDFRWLLEREDSPWYPSAKLYRQPKIGDWESVIARVTAELKAWPSVTSHVPAKSDNT